MKRFEDEQHPVVEDEDEIEGEDVVDEIGQTLGVTYKDDEQLTCGEKEKHRDEQRWELDPASAEDYRERMRHDNESDAPSRPLLHMTHKSHKPGHA